MPRVGILALIQESNTFLPGVTTLDHFRQELLLVGEDVRQAFATAHHEVRGFFDGLAAAGIEAVPLFAARALPFGTIEPEAFNHLLDMMLSELRKAGPLDGLLVAPHGATVSKDYPDADGEWLTRVRQAVGPDLPIVGTLDPHGNLSPEMVAATNALVAYRTNPHVDQEQRGLEAAILMVRTLKGEIRLVQAACYPPMAINIERQCTSESPCLELCAHFDEARHRPGVLGASLMFGFPYADVSEMGSSALVITDGQPELAQQVANELGQEMWNQRHGLAGTFLTVEEAVAQAVKLPGPVCMLDMGDNVGGGSPGDGTWIAWELYRTGVGPAFVCIDDADAVRAAEATGVGNTATFTIGGRTDDLHGAPLVGTFRVEQLTDGRFKESEVRHGGFTEFDQGRTAILKTDRGLTIMVTTKRTLPFSLKQLTAFGLQPDQFQIIVAKGVNAPLAAYRPVCPSVLRVNTRGVTMADMTQLPYQHRRKPVFPFEVETTWSIP
ncbi:M81 family metallopeptidase [Schlesneria sp. DSM 10557]|uniref:M81 family metallopeptidase n=1 Tax=Schlesneria sp. DSM 10557 TaxID=3044399 RepID=UPI0035A1B0EB